MTRTMSIVTLATGLPLFSVALFVVTGLSYLVVPGILLAVVEIESTSTTDFLLRTVGVALLWAAGFVWAPAMEHPVRCGSSWSGWACTTS
jgi:hypothetical protein